MTTIVVFASSLFVASALVSVKAVELKYKKKNMILELLSHLDSKSDKLVATFKFKILQLTQSLRYIALVKTKIIYKRLLNKIEEKIMEEYRIRQEAIMGRKNLANKGSASFYLKKITEDKSNGEKGKIEDTSLE